MSEYGDSFLLAPFREFYAEIIRLKLLAGAGAWVSPPVEATSTSQPDKAQTQTGTWVYYPDVVSDAGPNEAARITTQTLTPGTGTSTALVKMEPEGNGPASAVDALAFLQ